jgi:hypothetical protein
MKSTKVAIVFAIVSLVVLCFPEVTIAISGWTDCDTFGICDWVGQIGDCGMSDLIGCPPGGDGCACDTCPCIGCVWSYCECCLCSSPPCGSCFTGETEIDAGNSLPAGKAGKTPKLQIKDLKEGDLVSSFDPETGEIKENTVSGILKFTREGYYELETESGKKVEVTGEHPFLAVRNKKNQSSIIDHRSSIIDILSHTLTYKLITALQAKASQVLR